MRDRICEARPRLNSVIFSCFQRERPFNSFLSSFLRLADENFAQRFDKTLKRSRCPLLSQKARVSSSDKKSAASAIAVILPSPHAHTARLVNTSSLLRRHTRASA